MNDIKALVKKEKLIVIVRGVDADKLVPLAEAMYAGGIRLLEVTFDATGRVTDEETAERIRTLVSHFGDRLAIGAGTVLTERQVTLTKEAGGRFIISPDTCEAVIRKTKALGLISMPGALTPSEITAAHRAGADFVKLFPVTSLGAAYVKAIRAPLSHVSLLAVGGVDDGNMAEYLSAGVAGFGIGSNIIDKAALAKGDYAKITALAEKYVQVVKKWQAT